MMVLTAKVDFKKVIAVLAGIVLLIVGLAALFGRDSTATAAPAADVVSNDDRIRFLSQLGWEVSASPTESMQVRIPKTSDTVFDRYNALQKSQGYDLSAYAGKNVMRYVYKVENYPGATEPVYATLLICKNQVIGGDITDTAAKGVIRSLNKTTATVPESSSPAA